VDKKSFRELSKKRLQAAQKKSRYYHKKSFEKILFSFLIGLKAQKILLYIPMKIEPNPRAVIRKLRALGLSVFVPFIDGISFKIVKYRGVERVGAFGIGSVGNSFLYKTDVDATVVPVLGIDSEFARVGFGKGMYDRFFAKLKKRPAVLFVSRELSFSDTKLSEPHDVVGDYMILPDIFFSKGLNRDVDSSYDSRCLSANRHANRLFCSQKTRLGKVPNIHRAGKIKS